MAPVLPGTSTFWSPAVQRMAVCRQAQVASEAADLVLPPAFRLCYTTTLDSLVQQGMALDHSLMQWGLAGHSLGPSSQQAKARS